MLPKTKKQIESSSAKVWLNNYQFNLFFNTKVNHRFSPYAKQRITLMLLTRHTNGYDIYQDVAEKNDLEKEAQTQDKATSFDDEEIRKNNRQQLEQFLSKGCSKLEKTIRRKVNHNDDAEDIIQQTYMEAWRCKNRFEGNSKPETWMCGIACNIIKKYIKERRKHITENIDDINEILYNADPCLELNNPSDIVEQTQEFEKIRKQLEKMPKNMKEIIETRLDNDDNYYETAEKLNIAVGTVRSRLSRAREKLRELQRINPV